MGNFEKVIFVIVAFMQVTVIPSVVTLYFNKEFDYHPAVNGVIFTGCLVMSIYWGLRFNKFD